MSDNYTRMREWAALNTELLAARQTALRDTRKVRVKRPPREEKLSETEMWGAFLKMGRKPDAGTNS